jgi:hypothetical protein
MSATADHEPQDDDETEAAGASSSAEGGQAVAETGEGIEHQAADSEEAETVPRPPADRPGSEEADQPGQVFAWLSALLVSFGLVLLLGLVIMVVGNVGVGLGLPGITSPLWLTIGAILLVVLTVPIHRLIMQSGEE